MDGSGIDPMLNRLSKPSNSVLQCKDKKQVRISSAFDGTRGKYISRRCRECWECLTSQKNDIVGKLLAQAAVCERVDLLTATYDGQTGQSKMGAKQRIPAHVQKFQKAIRQREHRALVAYNKAEKKLAAQQDREPKLIDASRNYIKFYPVFEFGTKNGRGHWHIMIFYESHFPLPTSVLYVLEPAVIPDAAKRVWYPQEIIGPESPTLPEGANDETVFDWRVKYKGSQKNSLWPHGFVNLECVSHDMRAVDWGGRSCPSQKPRQDMVKSMFYLLKYLNKPNTDINGRLLTVEQKAEQSETDKLSRGGVRLYRTGSQGLGRQYATAFGEHHAALGVPLQAVHFKVSGANVPRSHASLTRLALKLRSKHANEMTVQMYLAEMSKMVFQMQGGMFNACVDAYIEIAKSKGKTEEAMGEIAAMRLRQLAAKKANEWLRSDEGVFRRRVARNVDVLDHLWSRQTLKEYGETAFHMLSGVFHGKKLPNMVLPPEPFLGYVFSDETPPTPAALKAKGSTRLTEFEKLVATRQSLKLLGEAYHRVNIDRYKYETVKRTVSGMTLHNEPREVVAYNPNVDEYTQGIYEQTLAEEWEAFFEGCNEASDLIFAQEIVRGNLKPDTAKPWAVATTDAYPRKVLTWLNHSDQYEYPKQRERYIERFCAIRYLSRTERLLIAPDGRILLQKQADTIKQTYVPVRSTRSAKIIKRPVKRWGSRTVLTSGDLDRAINGQLPLRDIAKDCDSVFVNDTGRPFQNTWAMTPDAMQIRVLALMSPDIFNPARTLHGPRSERSRMSINEGEFIPF